jgi:hypothetical protein
MVAIQYTTILVGIANAGFEILCFMPKHRLTSEKGQRGARSPAISNPLADPFVQFSGTMICFYQGKWREKVTWIT